MALLTPQPSTTIYYDVLNESPRPLTLPLPLLYPLGGMMVMVMGIGIADLLSFGQMDSGDCSFLLTDYGQNAFRCCFFYEVHRIIRNL